MASIKDAFATHRKMKLFFAALLVLVGGFFVYKYSYIYIERQKFDKAEVAIDKVAASLRAQGIETEKSKGCGRDQGVYGPGNLSCSLTLTIASTPLNNDAYQLFIATGQTSLAENFHLQNSRIFSVSKPLAANHSEEFIYRKDLGCELSTDSPNETTFHIYFSCVQYVKFKLF